MHDPGVISRFGDFEVHRGDAGILQNDGFHLGPVDREGVIVNPGCIGKSDVVNLDRVDLESKRLFHQNPAVSTLVIWSDHSSPTRGYGGPMQWRIWAAIIVASLGWGTTGVATRAALIDGVPPIAMAAIRALLAAAVLFGVLLIRRHHFVRDPRRMVTGLVAGVLQLSIPFIFFTLAYQYASAGFVGLLTALIPLGTAIVANFLLPDEPMHVAKAIGLSVAFSGVALLLISGDSGLSEGGQPLLAGLLTLVAVTSVSFATVIVRGRPGTYEPIELTFMQFFVGIFVVGGAMLLFEGLPSGITAWGWVLVLYLTAFGSLLPTLLFYWVLQQSSSTKASLVGYVVPFIAIVAGMVLLDERLQFGIAVGGILILIGIVLTDRADTQRSLTG